MNIEKTAEALNKNNMECFLVKTREEARSKVAELLKKGAKVSVGGSMTLFKCGIIELLRSGEYDFADRYKKDITPSELEKIFTESFSADVYLTSSNAITENGELYNVDGNANRVAAMLYGPKCVIVVAGKNKIVKNLDEAAERVKKTAAPQNTKRLACKTYCEKAGVCMSENYTAAGMTEGCASPDRICSSYTIMAHQRIKDRVKVIIIDEEVGY